MGVLGDDDIEKLNESFKKRKIPKLFHDPKKAYNFTWWSLYGCIMIIFVLGAVSSIFWSNAYLSNELIKEMIEDRKRLLDKITSQTDLIIDNADCPSLVAMYHDAKGNPDLDYIKELIKDEIAFRCK